MGYRNYAPANGFLVNADGSADFTSVNSAIAAATAGQTIYLHGTVTENVTLKAGVDVVSWPGEGLTPNATIIGTCTLTTAGTVTISGIRLQTNSAALLAVTGSVASIVNLDDCYLNCTNNTGITFSSSSASSIIQIINCQGNLGTTGIALATMSSTGTMNVINSTLNNSGGSTTITSCSAGLLQFNLCSLGFPVGSTSTGGINVTNCQINLSNTIGITANGTAGGLVQLSSIVSGTASCITVGTGVIYSANCCYLSSSNTNTVTGAGAIYYSGLSGNPLVINTTTQTFAGTLQGNKTVAPTAGFLGEKIEVLVSQNTVSLVNNTAKTIGSISLTAGTWLLNGMGILNGILTGTRWIVSISATNNTVGSLGFGLDTFDTPTISTAGAGSTGTVPGLMVTVATTTTYYLVGQAAFTVGSAGAGGRLTATRVG
jgi:hypothetical protein